MAIPFHNFTTGGKIGNADGGASSYATAQQELLEFTDARDGSNGVTFIAFLGSFSQSFTSNWNQEEVIGRMDAIATFKNTTRSISVEWSVPAPNPETASDNLNRCNALVSLLYPTYTKAAATVMSKPPLVRLRYSNLIRNQSGGGLLGYITSLNWSPVLEMGSYHTDGKTYPKVITISIEFTVLHEPTYDTGGPTGYFPSEAKESLLAGGTLTQDVFETETTVVDGEEVTKKVKTGTRTSSWPFGIGDD